MFYRLFCLLLSLGFLLSCQVPVSGDHPTASKTNVQYDATKEQYRIETGAKLVLGIDNDAYGNALIALWNSVHPEASGAVTYLKTPSDKSAKSLADLQGKAPDVVITLNSDVSKFAGAMAAIDGHLTKVAADNLDPQYFQSANASFPSVLALPFAYDGMTFAWNKTMLTQLGLIGGQVTKDNLPVEFSTWEQIFALGQAWDTKRPTYLGKAVNTVFPMCLDEPWSGYPTAATSAGWGLFSMGDATKPGFEDPKFAQGLGFLVEAAKAKLSVEANGTLTPGASMGWRWDPVLNDQTAPFGLLGTWMDIKGATTRGGYDMQFGLMPTFKGVRPAPFLKVKVYVLNAYSKFPSAATELLRLVFTKEGLQTMIDNSAYVPALKVGAIIAPDFSKDKYKQQMAAAFQFSYAEPVNLKLPANSNKQAMDVYYNIGIPQFYKDVWDGKLTPDEAQKAIAAASDKWIAENNVK